MVGEQLEAGGDQYQEADQHRNGELGRETSPEERAFLEGGGFAG